MKPKIRSILVIFVLSSILFTQSQAAGPIYYKYNMVDQIFVNGLPDPIWYESDYIYTSEAAAITAGCIALGPVSRVPNVGPYIRWSFYDGSSYDFYRCHYVNLDNSDGTNPEIILQGSTGYWIALHGINPHTEHPSCNDGSGKDYYFDPALQICTLENPDRTANKKQFGESNCNVEPSVMVGN